MDYHHINVLVNQDFSMLDSQCARDVDIIVQLVSILQILAPHVQLLELIVWMIHLTLKVVHALLDILIMELIESVIHVLTCARVVM